MPLLEFNHDWGEVTEERSEVRSTLALNAPAPLALELDGVSVHYTALLNGEALLETEDKTVSMGSSGTEIAMNATLDHDAIPEWWAGHVARGERSELAVEPELELDGGLGSASLATPTIRGEISSRIIDKIGGLAGSLAEELGALQRSVFGRALLVPLEADATWVVRDGAAPAADRDVEDGDVDEGIVEAGDGDDGALTAVRIDIEVENGLGIRFPPTRIGRWLLGRMGYRLAMNGVTMGYGRLEDVATVPPGERRTYSVTIPLDDEALKRWWASHVERGEETTVEIDVVADCGFGLRRLRRRIHSYTDDLTTDILSAVSIGGRTGGDGSRGGESGENDDGAGGSEGTGVGEGEGAAGDGAR